MRAESVEGVRLWLAAVVALLLPLSVNLRGRSTWLPWITLAIGTLGVAPLLEDRAMIAAWAVVVAACGVSAFSLASTARGDAILPPPPEFLRFTFSDLGVLLAALSIGAFSLLIAHGPDAWDVFTRFMENDRFWVFFLGLLIAVFLGDDLVIAVVQLVARRSSGFAESIPRSYSNPYIGWLERVIMYSLLVAGEPSAAALAFTAKSLVRFPEINRHKKDRFAEYVLLGTLASILAAAAVAVLVRVCFGMDAL